MTEVVDDETVQTQAFKDYIESLGLPETLTSQFTPARFREVFRSNN